MAQKSYGIYYNGETAIGVSIVGSGQNCSSNIIVANSAVSGADQLAEISSKMSGSRPLALALCGTLYINHDHRSEFDDIQQAAQTLRFDIEDHLAVDADNITISYQEKPTQTSTVDLIVYTSPRNQLTDIFNTMKNNGSDPLAALPSAAAWQIYLANAGLIGENAFYIGRCGNTLHIMILNAEGKPVTCRKFPVNNDSAFHTILKLELSRCSMTALPGMDIKKVYYHSDGISESVISDIVSDMDLSLKTIKEASFARAAAIGAAISIQKGMPLCNFRADNMEPESMKKDRFTAILSMSVLACLTLLAWTAFNIISLSKYKDMYSQAQENMIAAAEKCGVDSRNEARIPNSMQIKLRDIKKIVEGRGSLNSNSASSTFSLATQALSNLNPEFDLDIKAITFKPNEIKPFTGTVPDLEALQTLRSVLDTPQSHLTIAQETSKQDGERMTFEMPLIGK